MVHGFGDFELDPALFELRRRGRVVRVEPRVFDVLYFLLRNQERVVSKQELLDALWPGEAVSDSVLPRCIGAARRAVRDDRSRQRVIQTVHGRGYRFVARVREHVAGHDVDDPGASAVPASGTVVPDRKKPSPPSDAPPPATPEARGFVGREAVMHRLRAALDAACAGRGRLVVLVGEPGIGKTRTVEELSIEGMQRGARWLVGRCYEGEGAPAFWPWLQVLRALLPPEELAARLPELGASGVALAPSRDDGEQVRFRLFDTIAQALTSAARETPLAIAIDDVHWADPDSLHLLRFLAGELRDSRVLLLASYRDVEVRRDHPLRAVLGALAHEPHCERIALRGLARDDVSALIDALGGVAPRPELVDAVTAMTEGNPFFVKEVVGLLLDEGRLEEDSPDTLTLSLPQGVRDAIGRRLDSMSDDCNALLRVAAVIGREFDTGLLSPVADSGLGAEAVLELLGEAEAARVLAESADGPGRYSFTHALLRQTLYEELRAPQRVALHRKVAQALEERYSERPDAPSAELAHHFFEAAPSGTASEAVAWSVRAAEHSHAKLAYDESARHYERAVEALDFSGAPDPTGRCELLIAWGDELRTGGSREAGRARLAEAADLARSLGRSDLLARAAIGYRGFGEMGVPPDAKTLALLEEARDTLGDAEPTLRARVLARLTGAAPYAASMATRDRLSQEAWKLASVQGDPTALVDAIGARYWATLGPDRLEERLAVADEARALSERLGDPRLELMAHEVDVGAYLMLGERAAFDAALDAYVKLADELRQPSFRFIGGIMRSSRAMNLGAFDEAEELIRDALERGRGIVPFAEVLFAGQVYWLLLQKGDLDRVSLALTDAAAQFRDHFASAGSLIDVLAAFGRLGSGDVDAARSDLDAIAAAGFADIERDEHWLLTMAVLAELSVRLSDTERGEQLYGLLVPYAQRLVSHDLLRTMSGSVHSVLGELAALLGRSDGAIAHFEQGLAREEALGALPAFYTSQAGLARALEARDSPGDSARARSLYAEAEAGMRRLGGQLPQRLVAAADDREKAH